MILKNFVYHFLIFWLLLVGFNSFVKSICLEGCHEIEGHGFCLNENRCICHYPYTGPSCNDREIPELTCEYNCNKRGKCSNGVCFCYPGWIGIHCEIAACPFGCSKHGLCQYDPSDNSMKCVCEAGFYGEDCSFVELPQVFGFTPDEGLVQGGTIITVFGENFVPTKSLKCKVGKEVPATFISGNKIQCKTPSLSHTAIVNLAVTNDGKNWMSPGVSPKFHFLPVIKDIFPDSSPVKGGGTLTIYGTGFCQDVRCRIGNGPISIGEFVSNKEIRCPIPPGPKGTWGVKISCGSAGRWVSTWGENPTLPFEYE